VTVSGAGEGRHGGGEEAGSGDGRDAEGDDRAVLPTPHQGRGETQRETPEKPGGRGDGRQATKTGRVGGVYVFGL